MNILDFNKNIIEMEGHSFLYGSNTATRTNFLKNIASNYPINFEDKVVVIYVDCVGLPLIDNIKLDTFYQRRICREYLILSIVFKLVEKLIENIYILDKDNISSFLEFFNNHYIFDESITINNIEELNAILSEIIKKYYIECIKSLKNEFLTKFIKDPNIKIDFFVELLIEYKKIINSNKQIVVILDCPDDMLYESFVAINDLVGSKITKYISLKIASNANSWKTYSCSIRDNIQCINDYNVCYLEYDYNEFANNQFIKKINCALYSLQWG